MQVTKKTLYRLSVLTLFGFSLLGFWVISAFQEVSIAEVLIGETNFLWQLAVGFIYGFIVSLIALSLIRSHFLESVTNSYAGMFSNMDLRMEDIIFFSFCAGVGEEIFFRAALQPFMGIWITAIFFVTIHGYLNPRNWRMMLYGIILVLIVGGMGYLFAEYGIWAAAAAHFIFDVVMFRYLIHKEKNNNAIPNH